jgi:hypothetical protein
MPTSDTQLPKELTSIIHEFVRGDTKYFRSKMKQILQTNKQRYDNWLEDRLGLGLVRENEYQCKSSIWAWMPDFAITKEECKALGYPTHMLGYMRDPIQWFQFLCFLSGG